MPARSDRSAAPSPVHALPCMQARVVGWVEASLFSIWRERKQSRLVAESAMAAFAAGKPACSERTFLIEGLLTPLEFIGHSSFEREAGLFVN